jgi:hypothetical protein
MTAILTQRMLGLTKDGGGSETALFGLCDLSERHGCYWPRAMFTRHGRIIIRIVALFY